MFKKLAFALVLFAFASVSAMAADFNGKWTASVETPRGTQTIAFTFHVDGAKLTGTVTTPRGDMDISDGKIDGDSISFAQVMNFNGNEFKILYTGKADGADSIKFTRQMGDRPANEFTATRVKP
jgi:hypothetical protein